MTLIGAGAAHPEGDVLGIRHVELWRLMECVCDNHSAHEHQEDAAHAVIGVLATG